MERKREFTKKDTLAVKGMAILALLFYHLFENSDRVKMLAVDYGPFSLEHFLLLSGFGNICVAVFAFLSAYGIVKGIKSGEKESGELNLHAICQQALKRYLKLTANFLFMFLGVNLFWFSKFDYAQYYGDGFLGGLYIFLDALGLAAIYKTPILNITWWYMELAILIIFFVPLLYLVVKKMGNYTILLGLFFPMAVELNPDVKRYYFVVLLGVMAASGDWLEKLFMLKTPFWIQAFLGAALLFICIPVRQNYTVYHEFGYLIDAPIALFFSWFVARLLSEIKGVGSILRFLGRHSMNIYFVHTFFYLIIHQEFIYSFRYAGLIFLALLACALGFSVALEMLKKLLGYQKLLTFLT